MEAIPGPHSAHEYTTISEVMSLPCSTWSIEVSDGEATRRVVLSEGQGATFGASPWVHVQIDDPSVSARHGEAWVKGGQLWVRDLGSRNGIYVAGARVAQATFDQGGCFVAGRTLLACSPQRAEQDGFDEAPLDGVVGQSLEMKRLARGVRRAAALRAPVLVRGETGSGKELVAQALHRLAPWSRGPFLPVNMGALSTDLIDAELFGHEKGAFTGAVGARPGAFEEARGGTLFLDEIAELPMTAQAKLLRALENSEIRPLGASRPRKIDVRVVAASWGALGERVAQGQFREDLFHRLAVLTLWVPPLRERRGDIGLLSRSFLAAMTPEVGPKTLTSGALSKLAAHGWPGNVRELKNVLLRSALVAPQRCITSEHVAAALSPFQAGASNPPERSRDARRVLEDHQGNLSSAARAMGVARSTLRLWVKGKKPAKGP